MKLLFRLRKVILGFEPIASNLKAPAIMPRRRKFGQNSREDGNDPFALRNIVKKIESFAPRQLAESWDNVGLLVEPPSPVPVKRVLLTNDLSEEVLEEAISIQAQLIISYHPLIFPSFKTLTATNWKQRILGTLLQRQIALYSPHTAWDCVEGGVNDWLARAFGKKVSVKPLKHYESGDSFKVVKALYNNPDSANKAAADINAAISCSVHGYNQRDGTAWLEIHIKDEYLVLPFLRSAQNVNINQARKAPTQINAGQGRIVILKNAISVQEAIHLVKCHLNLQDLSVAIVPETDPATSMVSTIALCAGSGASVLKGVQADLYLTGEMSHHEVLDTVQNGIHVILTRHSNSERGFLEVAARHHLKSRMPQIEFIVSSKDKDPLQTM